MIETATHRTRGRLASLLKESLRRLDRRIRRGRKREQIEVELQGPEQVAARNSVDLGQSPREIRPRLSRPK